MQGILTDERHCNCYGKVQWLSMNPEMMSGADTSNEWWLGCCNYNLRLPIMQEETSLAQELVVGLG